MLVILAVGIGSFIAGALLNYRYVTRATARARRTALPTPLAPEVYAKRRVELVDMYRYGQQQYDRLVPWGSGGALLVSITLLEKLIQVPAPGSMPILAVGWGWLFAAL